MKPEHSSPDNTYRRIAVVLSTFNGERFLPDLLESILQQSWPYWDLWVRDDGSTDGTLKILESYRDRMSDDISKNRMYLTTGKNIGVPYSFFSCLSEITKEYDGFAFCDQDDIWLPGKLERAAEYARIRNKPGLPYLYHGRQILTDSENGAGFESPLPRRTGLSNAIIQNQVVGCSMVIDNRLRQLILDGLRRCPDKDIGAIIMHDWWCYLVASAFGVTEFDSEPVIRFRRHQHSKTPGSGSIGKAWARRAGGLGKRSWRIRHIMDQVELFHRLYLNEEAGLSDYKISSEKRQLINAWLELKDAGWKKRLHYFFTGPHKRSGQLETLLFRIMILINRY